MEPAFWEKIITEAGPLALVIIFFIYRDFKREEQLSAKLSEYEVFIRTHLMNNITQVVDALRHNTEALEALSLRPCLWEKHKND